MLERLLMLPLLLAGIVLSLPLEAAAPYRPPNLKKELFDTKKIELDQFTRPTLVRMLVSVARDFDDDEEVDFELRAHALAIAARLDDDNDEVESTLAQLKDNGKTIGEDADKSRVSRRLTSGVQKLLKAKDNEENQVCAAYVVDVALRLDPEGSSAEKLEDYREELGAAGHKANWSGMLGSPIRHSRNPWDEEEEVFEKKEVTMPGGDGKKFAKPQSRVNGLVVRQLRSGNLAGSASTVNATALTEEGQRGLLFTFNQDVGPMMGGSLEEVIKFLRIRYDSDPDKIPEGYKIELGFQDKYVPKDGPSAATAFTLLLDSLFSGEELDEEFACTGDMTADGLVQKIGGAAAKIRGATKRGCKIVGIPVDNGPEIGDLLLLDGIEQLLEIQIFTMKDFDEAYAISRVEKSDEVVETLALFREVADVIDEKGEEVLANAEVQKRLQDVLDKMSNHLSARLLLEKGQGKNSKVLTVRGTLKEIEIASSGTMRQISRMAFNQFFKDDDDEGDEFEIDEDMKEDAKEAAATLETLSEAIDPRVKGYQQSVIKVCKAMATGPKGDEDGEEFGERLKELLEKSQKAYGKMMEDESVVEDME